MPEADEFEREHFNLLAFLFTGTTACLLCPTVLMLVNKLEAKVLKPAILFSLFFSLGCSVTRRGYVGMTRSWFLDRVRRCFMVMKHQTPGGGGTSWDVSLTTSFKFVVSFRLTEL